MALLDPNSGFRELALLDALGSIKETKVREMEAFQLGLGGALGAVVGGLYHIMWAKD